MAVTVPGLAYFQSASSCAELPAAGTSLERIEQVDAEG